MYRRLGRGRSHNSSTPTSRLKRSTLDCKDMLQPSTQALDSCKAGALPLSYAPDVSSLRWPSAAVSRAGGTVTAGGTSASKLRAPAQTWSPTCYRPSPTRPSPVPATPRSSVPSICTCARARRLADGRLLDRTHEEDSTAPTKRTRLPGPERSSRPCVHVAEMLELTRLALVTYRLPSFGGVVPLLQDPSSTSHSAPHNSDHDQHDGRVPR
jgi:hypothetical protein